MKHKFFERQVDVVDSETGVVTGSMTTEKKFVYSVESDRFYMTFIDFAAPIYKLSSASAKSVLQWMCCNAEFNTGVVLLPSPRMKDMSNELNLPMQTIYNNLTQLKKLGLITGERGQFMLNPEIFWKGDMQARRDLLAASGSTFNVTFSIAPNENFENQTTIN